VDEIRVPCSLLDSVEFRALKPKSRDLYFWLLRLRQRFGSPFKQDERHLCADLGTNAKTLRECREQLEANDLIIFKRGGYGHSSVYKIVLKPWWWGGC
jgi:hypothetical protein